MYEPGEFVVCVDDKFHPEIAYLYQALPVKNRVYTVRECTMGRTDPASNGKGAWETATFQLLLVELVNGMDPSTASGCQEELGFKPERFVPLDQIHEQERQRETLPAEAQPA